MAIRRELAAASPDRYRPEVAGSLSNLGVRYSGLRRPTEALPVTQDAVRAASKFTRPAPSSDPA